MRRGGPTAHPPVGAAPLEWVLLTSAEVTDGAGLRRVSEWYGRRWVVEDYHTGLKTGVGIERSQLETRGALDAAIGLLSVVAVALVNLRPLAARPRGGERPAREVVPGRWVDVLSAGRYRAVRVERRCVREHMSPVGWLDPAQATARLGGPLARVDETPRLPRTRFRNTNNVINWKR